MVAPLQNFVTVKNHPAYEINQIGIVRRKSNKRICRIHGGSSVKLHENKKVSTIRIHILMQENFENHEYNDASKWRIVHGFPRYRCSINGEIRNVETDNKLMHKNYPKFPENKNSVTLWDEESKPHTVNIKQILYETFTVLKRPDSIWKDIPGFDNYQASICGLIWSKKMHLVMSPTVNDDNYSSIRIVNEHGIKKTVLVHKLIMLTFGPPKPSPNMSINHKNGIHDDNAYSNLEWATPSEQSLHAIRTGLRTFPQDQIDQFDLNDNYIQTFNIYEEICTALNRPLEEIEQVRQGVQRACSGEFQTSAGFKWKYTTGTSMRATLTTQYTAEEGEIAVPLYFQNKLAKYKITNFGKVLAQRKGIWFVKLCSTKNGYFCTNISLDKKRWTVNIHRLVALHFLARPLDYATKKYVVDHIDENRKNNKYLNLQWVTRSENMRLHKERKRAKKLL